MSRRARMPGATYSLRSSCLTAASSSGTVFIRLVSVVRPIRVRRCCAETRGKGFAVFHPTCRCVGGLCGCGDVGWITICLSTDTGTRAARWSGRRNLGNHPLSVQSAVLIGCRPDLGRSYPPVAAPTCLAAGSAQRAAEKLIGFGFAFAQARPIAFTIFQREYHNAPISFSACPVIPSFFALSTQRLSRRRARHAVGGHRPDPCAAGGQ